MRHLCTLLALLAPALLNAQATVRSDARLLSAPSGRALATFRSGATVQTGTTRAGATQVTLQGYIHRSLLGAARDSFRISVRASSGALLRAAPSRDGRAVALLHNGMGLHEVSRRGEWVQVRRTAWVPSAAVERSPQAARPQRQTAPAPPAPSRATAAASTADATETATTDSAPGALDAEAAAAMPISEDMTPLRRAELSPAPGGGGGAPGGGAPLGSVEPGARVVPLARENGWVRVRVEGWVPEDALAMADSSLHITLSAADIRADPEAAKGRAVRWEVQVLAFQTADQLRRDMKTGEPYLLARGPAGENAILYLALPESLAASARGIPALSTIVVTGRVRTGRSSPAGVPIIDVQSLSRR